MKRDLMRNLQQWITDPLRKPLIIRGARQVGKSWLIKEFSKQFDHYIELNFEKDNSLIHLFQNDINISQLTQQISLITGKPVIPGKTLLFLDEIQACERAITALRYFKEDQPNLHVIAAGSLIDFALNKEGIPVGRVQFMYLHPLSFGEFLTAMGKDDLRQYTIAHYNEPLNQTLHHSLNEYLKTYFWLGGMPAVVQSFLDYKDVAICQKLQDEIIEAYRQDFLKYAKKNQIFHLTKVLNAIPRQLGCKFKFVNVDHEIRSSHLKSALDLLSDAGIAKYCYHTAAQAQPLGAEKNEKRFKVYFFDIGLVYRLMGMTEQKWILEPLSSKTTGPLTEQFVAQELIAHSAYNKSYELYYWHREAKNSNAEVDFVLTKHQDILPVEVKAGSRGTVKSIQSFLKTHEHSHTALKIFERPYAKLDNIIEIPFYSLEAFLKAP